MIGSSSSPATNRTRRSQSLNGDTSIKRDLQQVLSLREHKDIRGYSADELANVLQQVLVEQEEQQNRHQSLYSNLETEHRSFRKDNARLRRERDILRQESDRQAKEFGVLVQDHKRLNDDFRNLNNEHEYVESRYKYVMNKVLLPYREQHGLQLNDQSGPTFDVILDPLIIDACEASSLRNQVQLLQKEMLASVEKDDADSDEHFAREFRVLTGMIKTLSRTMKPAAETNLIEALKTPPMLQGVSEHHWEGRVRKKLLIEAWTWSALHELIFRHPFAIYGTKGDDIMKMWAQMFGSILDEYEWPASSALSEAWRRITIEKLQGDIRNEAMIKGTVSDKGNGMESSALEARRRAEGVLQTYLSKAAPNLDASLVSQIISKAYALATQMVSQRARFQMTWPKPGIKFSKGVMVAITDVNSGDDTEEGNIAFVVNPGLTKWGDEHGKHLDVCLDIVPPLVALDPVVHQQMPKTAAYADVLKRES
ncbi:hypothetical protein ACN47E_003862 [Coniothyrium glycines]